MKISASILDQDMVVLPSVNVFELGTNNSTQTNADGRFTINVANEKSQLRFTHQGYDYDTVDAGYFNKMSYFNLYKNKTNLQDVNIIIPNKASSNLWLWILGFGTVAYLYKKTTNKNKK